MNKRLLLLMMAALLSISVSRGNGKIPMMPRDEEEANEHPRSIIPEVTASIDGVTITLNLNLPSDCEYSVYACSSDTVICSGRFATGSATAFDLPVSILSGTYQLCVYAYGCWWTGTFVY